MCNQLPNLLTFDSRQFSVLAKIKDHLRFLSYFCFIKQENQNQEQRPPQIYIFFLFHKTRNPKLVKVVFKIKDQRSKAGSDIYLISLSENQKLWLIKKSTLWFFAQPALKSFHMRRKILDQLFTNLLNKYSMKEPNLCRPEPAHLFLRSWIKEFSFSKTPLIIHSSQGDFKVSIKCANKRQ